MSICCRCDGAEVSGLLMIIMRVLWLLMTWKPWPYGYIWNLCVPNTMSSRSCLIHVYFCSVCAKLMLAYVTGDRLPAEFGCSSAVIIHSTCKLGDWVKIVNQGSFRYFTL